MPKNYGKYSSVLMNACRSFFKKYNKKQGTCFISAQKAVTLHQTIAPPYQTSST